MKAALIILCSLLLLACTTEQPQTLGIPLSQWQKMSSSEQQKLIKNYNGINDQQYPDQPQVVAENIKAPSNQLPNTTPLNSIKQKSINNQTKKPQSWLQLEAH